jgi:hypothetical protein
MNEINEWWKGTYILLLQALHMVQHPVQDEDSDTTYLQAITITTIITIIAIIVIVMTIILILIIIIIIIIL